jgi:hypothetical protein
LIIDPLDWVSRKIASSWEIVLPASLKDTRDFQEYFDTVLQTLPDRNGFTTIPLHVRIPAIPNGPPRGTSKVLYVLIAGLIAFGFPMALLDSVNCVGWAGNGPYCYLGLTKVW